MIEPFEQLFAEEFLKQEILDEFGEFEPLRWDLNAKTGQSFAAFLETGKPIEEYYRDEIGFVYQSMWNCATHDERSKYLAIRRVALENGYTTALDYGCGIGTGVVGLALAGLDRVIGAEINLPCLKIMDARKERFGLENMIVKDVYEKGLRYKVDLLVCTEVFEHVPDPIDLMVQLDKRLNLGGMAVLSWSFVPMPTHLEMHFDSGLQHSHPDTITTEGFGKIVLLDTLGYEFRGHNWFNNSLWYKPKESEE